MHGTCCFLYPGALISWSVPGDVSVGIKCDARVLSEDEEDVDFDIIHNANDTFTVKYVPPAAGRYTIKVLFASQVCVWTWVLSGHLCAYSLFFFFKAIGQCLENSAQVFLSGS